MGNNRVNGREAVEQGDRDLKRRAAKIICEEVFTVSQIKLNVVATFVSLIQCRKIIYIFAFFSGIGGDRFQLLLLSIVRNMFSASL